MNANGMKQIWPLLFVGLLLAGFVGVGIYLFASGPDTSDGVSKEEKQAKVSYTIDKLKSLYEGNDTRKCTYDVTVDGESATNTLYFSDGRSFSVSNFDNTQFYTLYRDGTSYSWERGSEEGLKTTTSIHEQYESIRQSVEDARNTPNIEEVRITCAPWQGDESYFTLPSDVSFSEVLISTD